MRAEPAGLLVDGDWLASHLDDASVRIIDASFHVPGSGRNPADEFFARHIPGAAFFDVDGIRDEANHLWQDLGLPHRGDLSALLHRHFRPLAERNDQDMKWKKFFYRKLCEREGVLVCKAPNCAVCDDVGLCFGAESGEPLARFQDGPRG